MYLKTLNIIMIYKIENKFEYILNKTQSIMKMTLIYEKININEMK